MAQITLRTLDEALVQVQFGKFQVLLMIICAAVMSCGFFEPTSVTLILPIAQCELKLSNFDKGVLGAMGYVGIILSSHLWGFLADTLGRKKIIVPTLLMSFVFSLISSLANSFWLLAVMRFLVGFCVCAPQMVSVAYLGEFFSSKHKAKAFMITSVIYGFMCFILPLNGYLFINQDWSFFIPIINLNFTPWRLYLIMNGIPSVVSGLLLLMFIPESPKFVFSRGDEAKTLKILRKIHKVNTGCEDFDVKTIVSEKVEFEREKSSFFKFMWTQTTPLFNSHHLRNILTASFLQFGFCLTGNGFWTFYPEILNKVYLWLGDNPSGHATICEILDEFKIPGENEEICIKKLENSTFINIAILELVFTCGLLLTTLLINRGGKLICILMISIPSGLCAILVMFVSNPEAAVYLYVAMLAAAINISVTNASTVDLFPTSMRAMAVSMSMMSGRIGSIVGSNVIGLMIRNYCQFIFLIPAFLLLSGSALAFTIPNIMNRNLKK